MTQLNVNMILHENVSIDANKLQNFSEIGIGSYFGCPFGGGPKNGKSGWNATEWRNVITEMQNGVLKAGKIPVLFGVDSVHGAVFVKNAVLFSQQINAGATFNEKLSSEMGRVTGKDTVAAGIPWIFAPMLGISTVKKWPRVYGTFGEDPYLVTKMGTAMIRGMQSNKNVAACMKHFVGYSNPLSGNDRDNVVLSDMELLNYYVPSFMAAAREGVLSIMEAYNSLNGDPIVRSNKLLRKLLRHDMGYKGMLVTDWAEIILMVEEHHVAKTQLEAVRQTLTRGSVDMSMVASSLGFIDQVQRLVKSGQVDEQRLDESVERIIQLKYALDLFDTPVPGIEKVDTVGSKEDVQIALDLARESIVLLKNKDGVLPLHSRQSSSILLTGPSADSINHLCGGSTISTHGSLNESEYIHGASIRTAMEIILETYGAIKPTLTYIQGMDINDKSFSRDAEKAFTQAKTSNYTIAVLGEPPYAEKSGDIPDLTMDKLQLQFVEKLASTGTKIILILVEGRPRLIDSIEPLAHAVLNAFLPCELGGQAIAEIIFGQTNPSGRLPISYPKASGNVNIPYYHFVNTRCGSGECEMQWSFGHGLSYTTFVYSPIRLSANKLLVNGTLTVSFKVTNSGNRSGKEVVLLYLRQLVRTEFVPEAKLLKRFEKINLPPGAFKKISYDLHAVDWRYFSPSIGNGFHSVTEGGDYTITVSNQSASFSLIKPETQISSIS